MYAEKKSHGIMYHHFHNDAIHIKTQGSLSSMELEKMLLFYQEYFNIISPEEYFFKSLNHSIASDEVCITFDDALKCQYDVAYPVLKKMGIKAFWFIYTSPLIGEYERLEIFRHFRFLNFKNINQFYEVFFQLAIANKKEIGCNIEIELANFDPAKYAIDFPFYTVNDKKFRYLRDHILGVEKYNLLMDSLLEQYHYNIEENIGKLWINREEISNLYHDGNSIGLHSHTHPTFIEEFTYEKQKKEYQENKNILEEIIKMPIRTLSYPCNSYNKDTFKILKEIKIQLAFRANMKTGFQSIYEIPREDHANILKMMQSRAC